MKQAALVSVMTIFFSACNWVQLTSAGRNVELATAAAVQTCQRIGSTEAETLDKLVLVERGSNTLQQELVTLARNEAGDLGGNRVVPESVITDGVQTFGVYRC